MQIIIGEAEVVKRAEGRAEAARLAREAEILSKWAHPGLVRLIRRSPVTGAAADEIVIAPVGGGPLTAVAHPPLELVAGWGAAVATVLDDLHSVGLAHGAVSAGHILLDGQGRPVLCGLGGAVRRDDGGDFGPACLADRRALVALLADLAPAGRDRDRLVARLERLVGPPGGRARRPGSPTLASVILRSVPGARVGPAPTAAAEADPGTDAERAEPVTDGPDPDPKAPVDLSPARDRPTVAGTARRVGRRPGAVVAAGALVSILLVAGLLLRPSPGHRPAPDAGPRTVSVVGPAYQLDTPAGSRAVTVLGRWDCGQARPALLYPAEGSVWVFSAWPTPGNRTMAVKTADVAGATGLAVQSGASGCDQLLVLRQGLAPVRVATGVPR